MAFHRAQGPYVVFTVFSGRRSYENILLDYLRKLLKDGSVGEVLLTVLAGSQPADREWLHDMRGSGEFSMEDIKTFSDAYKYIAMTWRPPEGRDDNTVVIKCDDDIVYVDLKHFGGFARYIATHQDMFIVFANTVNNQVAAHYQQLHGAIPNRSRSIDMEMPYPDRGLGGRLFEHPETAAEVHNIFLQDPGRFSWAAEENDGCIVYRPPGAPIQGRFSINFFGYRYSNRKEVARLAASNSNDEVALTFDNPHTNCMYTEFVVAHYAFAIQRKAFVGTDILDRYARLRNSSV